MPVIPELTRGFLEIGSAGRGACWSRIACRYPGSRGPVMVVEIRRNLERTALAIIRVAGRLHQRRLRWVKPRSHAAAQS